MKSYVLLIIVIIYLAICSIPGYASSDIEIVMNGTLPYDKSVTIGTAFNNFSYFESKKWIPRKEENKGRLVIFIGKLDLGKLNQYNKVLNGLQAAFVRVVFSISIDNSVEVKSFSYQILLPGEFKLLDCDVDTQVSLKDFVLNIYKNDSKSGLILSNDLAKAFPLLRPR